MKYKYNIVGISSCPSGIAHTYMNANAMVKMGKSYGIKVHIEKQGQLGIEDEVSAKEFKEADAIVICCGVPPVESERYEAYQDKVVELNYETILKDPKQMIKKLVDAGMIDVSEE